jgi:hypothetical protein
VADRGPFDVVEAGGQRGERIQDRAQGGEDGVAVDAERLP